MSVIFDLNWLPAVWIEAVSRNAKGESRDAAGWKIFFVRNMNDSTACSKWRHGANRKQLSCL